MTFRNSLAAKIIISVAITIAMVIGICTYIIVRVQTNRLMDKAKRNGIFLSHLIYQHISQAMLTGNREEIQSLFSNIRVPGEVTHIFVFDEEGKIAFSSVEREIGNNADDFYRRLFGRRGKLVNFEISEDHKSFSIVTPIKNKRECQRCHGKKRLVLGALGLDISLIPAEMEIARNRNGIIVFAFVILILVSAVISALIVVLVKRPVRSLIETMAEVEQGNLRARVNIRSKDELGKLGKSFNSMITNLEQAKAELKKHHEKQMQQAEKLATIGELASGIAHEIKNPLAGVSAAIQVLSEEFNLKSTRREIIDEIMHQMERLNKMTKDLLSFARPMEPRTLMCDVNDIVDKASFFIRKQAEKQNVGITKELERDIPHLLIDPEQIQQVFLNIMLNALQAMPEGGFLTIATRLSAKAGNGKQEAVEISFSDTGKGIPGENLRKIFNPFYTTKHQGTGLGLSISRNVVEKHKGRFEIDSQPGKGTRFTIILPVKEEGNG